MPVSRFPRLWHAGLVLKNNQIIEYKPNIDNEFSWFFHRLKLWKLLSGRSFFSCCKCRLLSMLNTLICSPDIENKELCCAGLIGLSLGRSKILNSLMLLIYFHNVLGFLTRMSSLKKEFRLSLRLPFCLEICGFLRLSRIFLFFPFCIWKSIQKMIFRLFLKNFFSIFGIFLNFFEFFRIFRIFFEFFEFFHVFQIFYSLDFLLTNNLEFKII